MLLRICKSSSITMRVSVHVCVCGCMERVIIIISFQLLDGQSARVHILLSTLGPQGLPPDASRLACSFSTLRSRSCTPSLPQDCEHSDQSPHSPSEQSS